MKAPAIRLPAPDPTPDQVAALQRAKSPRTHPYRAWHGHGKDTQRLAESQERIAPRAHRLVR